MDATDGPLVPDVDLWRARRAVLVADIVESVRLVEAFEADFIPRWRKVLNQVRSDLLPRCDGRMVKSLGDGMLLDFARTHDAVAVATRLHALAAESNQGRDPSAQIHLRVGVHVAEIVGDAIDVYGSGVNLAARLAGLAGAGQTVVSAAVRDELLPGLDPEVEDLGDCQLKNMPGSVRAFRVCGGPAAPTLPGFDTLWDSRPAFAMLPLETAPGDSGAGMIGEILSDQIVHRLSRTDAWRVVSRLSTSRLRGRSAGLQELQARFGLSFVLSGRCRVAGPRIDVSIELAHVPSGTVLWTQIEQDRVEAVLAPDAALPLRLVDGIARAVFDFELRRSRTQPLPTLASHTLLFAAIALTHRLSQQDFVRAGQLLRHLCERHPRAPEPAAWLAKWHVMSVVQGWSADPRADALAGHASAQRALDERSDHALGLAMDGLIAALLDHDFDRSERSYDAALASNPSEPLAWLFLSALHAYRDRGDAALAAARTALQLSPVDPIHYFFDTFAAHAMLAAGKVAEAIALADRSRRANAQHLPTWRTLAAAQAMAGEGDAARASVAALRALDPGYTLAVFQTRYPGAASAYGQRCAEALAEAGLPRG